MFTLSDLFDQLRVEGWQIIRGAARNQSRIYDDFFINPGGSRVGEVGAQGGVTGDGTAVQHVRFGQYPAAMSDHSHGFVLLKECPGEVPSCIIKAQVVTVNYPAWQHQRIEICGVRVG